MHGDGLLMAPQRRVEHILRQRPAEAAHEDVVARPYRRHFPEHSQRRLRQRNNERGSRFPASLVLAPQDGERSGDEVNSFPFRLARLGSAQAGQDGEDQRQRRDIAVFLELLDQLGNVLPTHGGMIVAMNLLAGLAVALHGRRIAELVLQPTRPGRRVDAGVVVLAGEVDYLPDAAEGSAGGLRFPSQIGAKAS